MRFLFVLDLLPYPPRDGTTIPTFNWISRLSSKHNVSLLYVKNKMDVLNQHQVIENKTYVDNLWIIDSLRSSVCTRIREELMGRKPLFLGWSIDTAKLGQCLDGQAFDVVLGSPITVTETIESIYKMLGLGPVYVSGHNDSLTALLKSLKKRSKLKGLDFKTRLLYLTNWLRSWNMGRIEAKILGIYDLILLQSDVDKYWVDKISFGKLVQKTVVVSNGVNDDLFDLPIMNESKDILFLGILSNGYGKSLEWFMNNVWPEIRKIYKDIMLHVVGRGASDDLRSRMDRDSHITYTEYLPDICDVFKNKSVMLAPVFKGFGLINKVVESMAAGVTVVGTSDSFNGISGFSNGQHGIVANDADSFVKETLEILVNQSKRRAIADSARVLVKKNFSWDDRIRTIVKRIELIKRKK